MAAPNRHPRTQSKRIATAILTVLAAIALLIARQRGWISNDGGSSPVAANSADAAGGDEIAQAYREKRSDLWVEAAGDVVKLLPDDRDGDPHQKLLVRIDGLTELTVLIAHNLSAAERVPAREGNHLRFRGQYIWSERGGTVHFTHAPEFQRREPGGWIEFEGTRYE